MKLIGPFEQLITLSGLPLKGAIEDEGLDILPKGGIVVDEGKIAEVGAWASLRQNHYDEIEELEKPMVALPGLIDCHTHICFGGTRQKDYAMRIGGKSYLEIAKAGGGIWDTVTQTRAASPEKLREGLLDRLRQQSQNGSTTW